MEIKEGEQSQEQNRNKPGQDDANSARKHGEDADTTNEQSEGEDEGRSSGSDAQNDKEQKERSGSKLPEKGADQNTATGAGTE